jgi:hypothetical protein
MAKWGEQKNQQRTRLSEHTPITTFVLFLFFFVYTTTTTDLLWNMRQNKKMIIVDDCKLQAGGAAHGSQASKGASPDRRVLQRSKVESMPLANHRRDSEQTQVKYQKVQNSQDERKLWGCGRTCTKIAHHPANRLSA